MSPKNVVYAEFTRPSVMFLALSVHYPLRKVRVADEITILSINATQNDMMCACACGCESSGRGCLAASPLGVCARSRSGDPDLSVNMGALVNSLVLLRRLIVIAK